MNDDNKVPYPYDHEFLIASIKKHLESVIVLNTRSFPLVNGFVDDVIDRLCGPQLLNHGRGGEPWQKNGRWSRSCVEIIIKPQPPS